MPWRRQAGEDRNQHGCQSMASNAAMSLVNKYVPLQAQRMINVGGGALGDVLQGNWEDAGMRLLDSGLLNDLLPGMGGVALADHVLGLAHAVVRRHQPDRGAQHLRRHARPETGEEEPLADRGFEPPQRRYVAAVQPLRNRGRIRAFHHRRREAPRRRCRHRRRAGRGAGGVAPDDHRRPARYAQAVVCRAPRHGGRPRRYGGCRTATPSPSR